jgi:hypothetical protein
MELIMAISNRPPWLSSIPTRPEEISQNAKSISVLAAKQTPKEIGSEQGVLDLKVEKRIVVLYVFDIFPCGL